MRCDSSDKISKLRRDSQVLSWVLSYDGMRKPDALAITAAGAALALSEIPLAKPVAGVQVGWPEGSSTPVVNPTIEQMETRYVLVVLRLVWLVWLFAEPSLGACLRIPRAFRCGWH